MDVGRDDVTPLEGLRSHLDSSTVGRWAALPSTRDGGGRETVSGPGANRVLLQKVTPEVGSEWTRVKGSGLTQPDPHGRRAEGRSTPGKGVEGGLRPPPSVGTRHGNCTSTTCGYQTTYGPTKMGVVGEGHQECRWKLSPTDQRVECLPC